MTAYLNRQIPEISGCGRRFREFFVSFRGAFPDMGSVKFGNPGDGDIDFTDFIPGWIVDNAGFGKAENALKCADSLLGGISENTVRSD